MTLLEFVRGSKVLGAQATGNLPLKAVREVTARFVNPPPLESKIGDRTFRIRSAQDLWPLHILHVLADVGGLLRTGPSRRWRLTADGDRFLEMGPVVQAPWLLAVWWHRVNWLIAYPFAGMGQALPYLFRNATLASLQSLPTGHCSLHPICGSAHWRYGPDLDRAE